MKSIKKRFLLTADKLLSLTGLELTSHDDEMLATRVMDELVSDSYIEKVVELNTVFEHTDEDTIRSYINNTKAASDRIKSALKHNKKFEEFWAQDVSIIMDDLHKRSRILYEDDMKNIDDIKNVNGIDLSHAKIFPDKVRYLGGKWITILPAKMDILMKRAFGDAINKRVEVVLKVGHGTEYTYRDTLKVEYKIRECGKVLDSSKYIKFKNID